MSDIKSGTVQSTSGGGVSGTHATGAAFQFRVAPSNGTEFNKARLRLIPIACWRVDDIRFAFDSSFVRPEIREEMAYLAKLRDAHKQHVAASDGGPAVTVYPPLSLFGHADPVGLDDYNKRLSGRRATAIYALLTRRKDLWEKLYKDPEDHWGSSSINVMVTALGRSDVTDFQKQNNLDVDGQAGMNTRKVLFDAYMDYLCTPPFVLDKNDDFLVGTDNGGKGDYQGCGEFNPMILFSQTEQSNFAKPEDKEERDRANARNRRVMGLLFRIGSKVSATKWPCPRVSEGVDGCHARFWSDGESRRSTLLPDERREFDKTKDTFACRFYHRLTADSPCEVILPLLEVRLYDRAGKFIPNAPYKLTLGPGKFEGNADDRGWVRVPNVSTAERAVIYWSPTPTTENGVVSPPTFPFALDLFLDIDTQAREQRATQQLNNLGYPDSSTLAINVRAFQRGYHQRYSLAQNGMLDDATAAAIEDAHDSLRDSLRAPVTSTESG